MEKPKDFEELMRMIDDDTIFDDGLSNYKIERIRKHGDWEKGVLIKRNGTEYQYNLDQLQVDRPNNYLCQVLTQSGKS